MAFIRINNDPTKNDCMLKFYDDMDANEKAELHHKLKTNSNFFKIDVDSAGFFWRELNLHKQVTDKVNDKEVLSYKHRFCKFTGKFQQYSIEFYGLLLIAHSSEKNRLHSDEIRIIKNYNETGVEKEWIGILECGPSEKPTDQLEQSINIFNDSDNNPNWEDWKKGLVIEHPMELYFFMTESNNLDLLAIQKIPKSANVEDIERLLELNKETESETESESDVYPVKKISYQEHVMSKSEYFEKKRIKFKIQ